MKKASFIVLLLLTAGCASSLKNKWTNFTAYYNTFYNAKQDFHEGLKKVREQPVTLDADALVRPHPKPPLAGSEAFNEAIENGAQILRRFPESKWTDDALLLIGRSYYYLQENFLAIQKFEELLALPSETPLKQQAVIWKGRTLLDIQSYTRGVQYLQNALKEYEGNWTLENKAEVHVVLAEQLAMLDRWKEASRILELAIPDIGDRTLRGRSYLFLGQLLQKQSDYIRAFRAYSNVRRNYPDYEYIYFADVKKAEVSRLAGNTEQAISIYMDMLNDDKNYERQNELNYQLAQTYEAQGEYRRAEAMYKKILQNRSGRDFQSVAGDVYFHLGQIYSQPFNDYQLAAAYFDSSSQASQQMAQVTDSAGQLSSAYSRYVSLRNGIARIDSLLELGSFNDVELNNRLIKIREERLELMKNSQNAVQEQNNILSNTGRGDIYESTESAANAGASNFGFLNYKNAEMVARGRRQFEAIWGNRPLANNWRREETLSGASISEEADSAQNRQVQAAESLTNEEIGIDISEIPRTEGARKKLKQQRLNDEYRLGSLFFLTLNQPDSAAAHYQHVLHESAGNLRAQTLYSLYELYKLQQKSDSAAVYKQQILSEYPDSRFADRVFSNTSESATTRHQQNSVAGLRKKVQKILARPDSLLSLKSKADSLRSLTIENESSAVAPAVYYQGIREYIEWAKRPDSLHTMTMDSASSFTGPRWDRVRFVLQDFKKRFPEAQQISQINMWLSTLNHPEDIDPEPVTCRELGTEPKIIGGKQHFVDSVTFPESTKKMKLSGAVRYRFVIAKDGTVASFKLLSSPTGLGIEDAFNTAINEGLQFDPVLQNGTPVRAACEVQFLVKQ